MRKVPMDLIGKLNKGAEGQVLNVVQAPPPPKVEIAPIVAPTEFSGYYKEQVVPEGWYTVKLLYAKCHNRYRYWLRAEVVEGKHTGKIIEGLAERYSRDLSDLAHCFGDGTLYPTAGRYVGGVGKISVSASGWIKLMDRCVYDDSAKKVQQEDTGMYIFK